MIKNEELYSINLFVYLSLRLGSKQVLVHVRLALSSSELHRQPNSYSLKKFPDPT